MKILFFLWCDTHKWFHTNAPRLPLVVAKNCFAFSYFSRSKTFFPSWGLSWLWVENQNCISKLDTKRDFKPEMTLTILHRFLFRLYFYFSSLHFAYYLQSRPKTLQLFRQINVDKFSNKYPARGFECKTF